MELETTHFQKIIEIMQTYKVDQFIQLENVNKNIVSVFMNDSQISGEVRCAICDNDSDRMYSKSKQVNYFTSESTSYWITSNFATHLRKVHKLTASIDAQKSAPNKKLKKMPLRIISMCQVMQIY